MNRRAAAPTRQAGVTLIEVAIVAAIIAIFAGLTAPLWSHGTSLVASAQKTKIDIGERTGVAVVAYEKPRWTFTSRPVPGGTVTLKFDNGIQILPGAQIQATDTTNPRGESFFTVVGGSVGVWTGTATFSQGGVTWDDEAKVTIEVTGDTFEGQYQDGSSLQLDED